MYEKNVKLVKYLLKSNNYNFLIEKNQKSKGFFLILENTNYKQID
jgi:hypothetical protein